MSGFFHVTILDILRVIEVAAIVASLLYVARQFQEDAQSRRFQNLVQITSRYQDVWAQINAHPDLARIKEGSVDLGRNPITVIEDHFVRSLISNFHLAFHAPNGGAFLAWDDLRADAAEFFNLPIPHETWLRVRQYYPADFAAFVDSAIESAASKAA